MMTKIIHLKGLLLALPLVLALLITSTFNVSARPFYYGEAVPAGTIVQADVFLAGNNIVIDGTVVGDVFALGNNIQINGTVEGSLVAVAQTIRITGQVKGTTYATSIAFELGADATLERNLYYGGLSFATRKGSLVNRDLSAFSLGGTMTGQINGNVKAVIGPYEILKLIFDALKVKVQLPGMIYDEPVLPEAIPDVLPSPQATMQPTSSGDNPSSMPSGLKLADLQIGTPTATTKPPVQPVAPSAIEPTASLPVVQTATQPGIAVDWHSVGNWFMGRLRNLLVLAVFCLAAFWIMPDIVTRASSKMREKTLASLGSGLVGTLISLNVILAAILVAAIFTAIGFWLVFATMWELGVFIWSAGLCLVLLFIILVCTFVFYLTKAIVAYTIGCLILKQITPKTKGLKMLALLSGLIVYVLLAGLPYAGWVIGILATGFGFGSTWLVYRQKLEEEKAKLAPPAVPKSKMTAIKPVKTNTAKTRKTIKTR